jgi:hypothetical protein
MPPASFVYGQIELDFQVDDNSEGKEEKEEQKRKKKKARAIIKYRYYAQDNRVEYISVDYTDPLLKERIEGDPSTKERINEYVKSMLKKRNEGLS